jgi:hypothetical protein
MPGIQAVPTVGVQSARAVEACLPPPALQRTLQKAATRAMPSRNMWLEPPQKDSTKTMPTQSPNSGESPACNASLGDARTCLQSVRTVTWTLHQQSHKGKVSRLSSHPLCLEDRAWQHRGPGAGGAEEAEAGQLQSKHRGPAAQHSRTQSTEKEKWETGSWPVFWFSQPGPG